MTCQPPNATECLAARLWARPDAGGKLLVAESGIHTSDGVLRLARRGAHAILVGEALMREGRIAEKAMDLLGVAA